MKLLVMPNEIHNFDEFEDSNGFIVGIKGLSYLVPLEVTIDELKTLVPKIKKEKKELYISLNKLMYNQDIPLLKEYLLVMDEVGVDGILYDDLAILNLSISLKLHTPLVWFGIHSFTNYHTANYWYKKGVKHGILSTEITLENIKKIENNTNMSLMMYGYGYLPMFFSSRSLLSNYLEHIGSQKKDKVYHMYEKERDMHYPTYESDVGTIILNGEIINTIKELPIISDCVDYLILSSLNITNDCFKKIYHHYVKALHHLDDKLILNGISNDVASDSPTRTGKGFLYKETVYKVKNDGTK